MRLPRPACTVVLGGGAVLLGIAAATAIFGDATAWTARWPVVVVAILVAVLVAAMAARWLGRRLGVVAGLAQLSNVYVLSAAEATLDELGQLHRLWRI